ncbi:MAG: hypothetical protein WA705_31385 [Candidatus Ozemobacteraceae bacterium]
MERAMKHINIPLDSDLHRRMKTVAANLGVQIKDFVVDAIRQAVKSARQGRAAEEPMTHEDATWIDSGCRDLLETLTDIEKDVPPNDLKKYLKSFEKNSVPICWNPRTKSFEEVHGR